MDLKIIIKKDNSGLKEKRCIKKNFPLPFSIFIFEVKMFVISFNSNSSARSFGVFPFCT